MVFLKAHLLTCLHNNALHYFYCFNDKSLIFHQTFTVGRPFMVKWTRIALSLSHSLLQNHLHDQRNAHSMQAFTLLFSRLIIFKSNKKEIKYNMLKVTKIYFFLTIINYCNYFLVIIFFSVITNSNELILKDSYHLLNGHKLTSMSHIWPRVSISEESNSLL